MIRPLSEYAIRVQSTQALYGYLEKTCFDQVTICAV